jgi:hypothetical protein
LDTSCISTLLTISKECSSAIGSSPHDDIVNYHNFIFSGQP